MIVQKFMLTTVYGKDDNDNDGKETLTGDQGMNMFVPQYVVANNGAKVVSCYFVMIHNPLQNDYIVALLSAGLLFCQISRVVQENRDQLFIAIKLGGVSEGDDSNFLRVTCTLGLQMIAELILHSWAFSVATDVSTEGLAALISMCAFE